MDVFITKHDDYKKFKLSEDCKSKHSNQFTLVKTHRSAKLFIKNFQISLEFYHSFTLQQATNRLSEGKK